MIESSAAYIAAITGDTRRVLLKAVIHIIDPDIQLTGGSADSLAPWAKTAELYDYRFTTARYATLEQDRWLLDGSFEIFPDDYQVSEHMGVADAQLSGADGSFASPPGRRSRFPTSACCRHSRSISVRRARGRG
ncbi:MAG: hypothetical protein ACLSHJ_06845 [Oscillospiraceae bacterium]